MRIGLLVAALALIGCGDDDGATDSGMADTSTMDSSSSDTGTDSATADTGVMDASMDDAAMGDASMADASMDAAADACMPLVNNLDNAGDSCGDGVACPEGYTCQGFSGVVFAQSCQVLCEVDCDCPGDATCVEVSDKAATWMQCQPVGD